jgi:hypothetical protein
VHANNQPLNKKMAPISTNFQITFKNLTIWL